METNLNTRVYMSKPYNWLYIFRSTSPPDVDRPLAEQDFTGHQKKRCYNMDDNDNQMVWILSSVKIKHYELAFINYSTSKRSKINECDMGGTYNVFECSTIVNFNLVFHVVFSILLDKWLHGKKILKTKFQDINNE